jgi:hypothetical protein
MTRHWLATMVVLLALGLAACGGGGAGEPTPGAAETPAPTAEGTAGAEGYTITDSLFESQKNGYQARFPEGWTPRPDLVTTPGLTVDAFFGANEVEGVQPNVAVTCEELAEGTTLEDYFNGKMDIVKRVAKVEPEVSSRDVAGEKAMVAYYRREQVEAPFEKTEVYLINERCGWDISLTVPLNHGAEYQGPFEEFLDSFQFLS